METEKHTPLISIVTVTFNAEKEIEATLKSVQEQSFPDFEHIIVDGASKDSTLEIVDRYGNPSLRVYSKPDKGIYHGMNRGLKYSNGKYVIFLNAGDRFADARTLEKYAEKAKMGKEIIYGDTVIVDEEGKILRPRHLGVPEVLTVDSFSQGMLICHQAFMVRRDIAPSYSKSYKLSADYDWCIECIKASEPARCSNLDIVTIHYLDNGATEKHKYESLRERYRIMSHHYGALRTFFNHLTFIPRALLRKLQSP